MIGRVGRLGRLGRFSLTNGVSFSPLSLFSASEPGAWLDPSDLSTMFQDAAGTTPVTTPGQSVGLVLDKSKGLVLGPELAIPLPTPIITEVGSTSSWNASTRTMITTGGGSNQYPWFMFNLGMVVGRAYIVTISLTGDIAKLQSVRVGGGSGVSLSPAATISARVPNVAAQSVVFTFNGTAGAASVTIDSISVRELPGNHATQATAAARPTYQIDSNGRGYLSFDGVDDFLVTPTITPNTDKVQVFAGVRKLSDVATGTIAELSTTLNTNAGAFFMLAPNADGSTSAVFASKGSLPQFGAGAVANIGAAPVTRVLSGLADISADSSILRSNGIQVAQSTADQGTGNFLAYPIYIGRRAGTSLPFNGRIYGLIVRFGANLTADQITQTETWINSKTVAF